MSFMDAVDRLDVPYRIMKWREKWLLRIVWALPRKWITWGIYRAMAHATTGQWGSEVVDFQMPVATLIDRWLTDWRSQEWCGCDLEGMAHKPGSKGFKCEPVLVSGEPLP